MKQVASLVLTLAAPAALSFVVARVSGSSGPNYAAFAQAVAATLVALTAGAWYAQRWTVVATVLFVRLLILTIISLTVVDLMVGFAMTQAWS
jgi:hypothetical protein